jgi:hypothetical protein
MMLTTEMLVCDFDEFGPHVSYTTPSSIASSSYKEYRQSSIIRPTVHSEDAAEPPDESALRARYEAYIAVTIRGGEVEEDLSLGNTYLVDCHLHALRPNVDKLAVFQVQEVKLQITASGQGLDVSSPSYRSFVLDNTLDMEPAQFMFKPVRTGTCTLVLNIYCERIWAGETRVHWNVVDEERRTVISGMGDMY